MTLPMPYAVPRSGKPFVRLTTLVVRTRNVSDAIRVIPKVEAIVR